MKKALTLALLAFAAAALITGCQPSINSSPAAPDPVVDEGDRAGSLFYGFATTYDPFACTATVNWRTTLSSWDSVFHYGNSTTSLPYSVSAPGYGKVHSATVDMTVVNLVWFFQIEAKIFENMPPVDSDVIKRKRNPCLMED